ncbi:hypothetical protein MTP99_010442 [Tenebrio molitor]|nr:hypothetical protein MTP99_010442 [Tenebrio molitor]CAH1368947.1 unnamed protein product [Tenebrio molitor]
MESWIRSQCSFRNYRSHSFKLSQTLKSLFTGRKIIQNESDPFIKCDDEVKKDDNKGEEKIWRRLSLQSFRKRREKKQEDKNKPILPEVLKTYDKQKKQRKDDTAWL